MCSVVLTVPHPTCLLPVSSSIAADPGASPPPSLFFSEPSPGGAAWALPT